jgi:hypothetical protein
VCYFFRSFYEGHPSLIWTTYVSSRCAEPCVTSLVGGMGFVVGFNLCFSVRFDLRLVFLDTWTLHTSVVILYSRVFVTPSR